MITVKVEGYGTFQIEDNKVTELVNWLSRNEAVKVQTQPVKEVVNNTYTGRELLNG